MDFEAALKLNNLGDRIDNQYGRWGHFTKEAADLIIQAARAEISPLNAQLKLRDQSLDSLDLMTATAVTAMNESCFNIYQGPNTNRTVENWFRWDFGWMQLNLGWTMRMVWNKEINAADLSFVEVFGRLPYVEGDPFNGNPLPHTRLAIRRLTALKAPPTNQAKLSFNDTLEMQVVCYTGEANRPHRQQDWRVYKPLFLEFFKAYGG